MHLPMHLTVPVTVALNCENVTSRTGCAVTFTVCSLGTSAKPAEDSGNVITGWTGKKYFYLVKQCSEAIVQIHDSSVISAGERAFQQLTLCQRGQYSIEIFFSNNFFNEHSTTQLKEMHGAGLLNCESWYHTIRYS